MFWPQEAALRIWRRRHSVSGMYAVTFGAQVFATAGYLLAFRIVATRTGRSGFAEFALSRRTLALLSPLVCVGLDVGVARYLGRRQIGRPLVHHYVGGALLLLLLGIGVVTIPMLALRAGSARLFFGSDKYVDLILTLPLLLVGNGLYVIALGYLRGRLMITYANVHSVIAQGLVPIMAAFLGANSVPRGLTALGAGWTACSLTALVMAKSIRVEGIWRDLWQLARFGMPRLPGDFLRFGLFALPAIVIAHTSTIDDAGFVAFGVAALGLVGTSLAPISMVLLPYASQFLAAGDSRALRAHVVQVTRVSTLALVVGVTIIEALAPQMLRLYLGPRFLSGVGLLRLMMLGAVPWGLYMILRSVIDAQHERPVNGINTGIAFVCFVAFAVTSRFLLPTAAGITLALVGSLYVLGILTVFAAWRVLNHLPPGSAATHFEDAVPAPP